MILPDHELRKYCMLDHLIVPFNPANVQPASIDLTLGKHFKAPPEPIWHHFTVDLADVKGTMPELEEYNKDSYTLIPHSFVLGTTVETIAVPTNMVARVEGKSSLARLGLVVHATAGFCDPGFHGNVTLEFFNMSPHTIILRSGLRICQIAFETMTSEAETPYGSVGLGSKYQNQRTTEESRYAG